MFCAHHEIYDLMKYWCAKWSDMRRDNRRYRTLSKWVVLPKLRKYLNFSRHRKRSGSSRKSLLFDQQCVCKSDLIKPNFSEQMFWSRCCWRSNSWYAVYARSVWWAWRQWLLERARWKCLILIYLMRSKFPLSRFPSCFRHSFNLTLILCSECGTIVAKNSRVEDPLIILYLLWSLFRPKVNVGSRLDCIQYSARVSQTRNFAAASERILLEYKWPCYSCRGREREKKESARLRCNNIFHMRSSFMTLKQLRKMIRIHFDSNVCKVCSFDGLLPFQPHALSTPKSKYKLKQRRDAQ